MKTMKKTTSLIIFTVLLCGASIIHAASHATAPAMEAKKEMAASATLPMAEAEIRKIDLENKKVTLKHGEIKNLDMPGMTMVFQFKDAAMLEKVKAGDKVKFTADKVNGAYTVMSIEIAK